MTRVAVWTQERTHNIVLQVNYLGLQLYNLGEAQTLLASFHYLDSLVSWLALNDMLTLHVVHKPTRRSAKLHFLTREARAQSPHVPTPLPTFADLLTFLAGSSDQVDAYPLR